MDVSEKILTVRSGHDDVLAVIRGLLPSLRPAEQRVARTVLEDPGRVSVETIDRLAERAGTSTATVTRFCRSVEISGFQVLRMRLAGALSRRPAVDVQVGSDIVASDDLQSVVSKLGFASAQAIRDTVDQLDLAVLEQVVDLLEGAARIDLYGVGASGLVATDLQQKLFRVGRVAYACTEPHMARTGAALLAPGDVAIGFSETGETAETVRSLEVAKAQGAATVAVTTHPRSTIAAAAELVLCTVSHEVAFRATATSSRLAQLMIVDCLFTALAQRTFEQSRRALAAVYLAIHGDADE